MKKVTKRRIEALVLSAALVVTSFTGYERIIGKREVYAAEPETVIFAEGAGTGKDFNENNWVFDSKRIINNDSTTIGPIAYEAGQPGIVPNQYSGKNEKVLRLIRGVRSEVDGNGNATYKENPIKYNNGNSTFNYFRSGKATLHNNEGNGIALNGNKDFSMKFTFSMPEAVVNPEQTNGEQYAREVGGDGICFAMTTQSGQELGTGSGIGYQGMQHSVAIELDSFFNGAYIDNNPGAWGLANKDFDNQAIKDTNNYQNKDHNERYDHIAVTANGNVQKHIGEYYMDGTTTSTVLYNGGRTYLDQHKNDNAAHATSANDCETRFADVGANNRLFTVWAEYDGTNKKMYVSIANGDFKNAVRPSTPQINALNIDLDNYLEADKSVYLGFTSAVGTSKANHTIHAFQFINKYQPITNEAEYKVEYYLQDKTDSTKYNLQTEDTVTEENATIEDVVKDTDNNYKKEYEGYQYTTVEGKSISEIVVAADGTSVLKLYYNLKDEAQYKLNYLLKDKTTGEYVRKDSSDTKTGFVGATVNASTVDESYAGKYAAQHYELSSTHPQEDEVTLEEKDKVYEMNVYYDPQEADYQLHYWLYNPDSKRYEEKTEDASDVIDGFVGETYKAEQVNDKYAEKYLPQNYTLSTIRTQEDAVTLDKKGGHYHMNVYYDPAVASYKLNYWKYNTEKGIYELTDSTQPVNGYVGEEYSITDVDADYGTKYENYAVTKTENDVYSVKLDEAGKLYEMNVYYVPQEAGYRLNYHKLDPDTEKYVYVESTPVKKGEVGSEYTITDADSEYESKYTADGYAVNAAKNEDFQIKIEDKDKTYEMNVYYDPPKTTYKTEYYLEQPDGSFKKQDETTSDETYAGKTVYAEEKTYDGYTHVTVDESLETDKVKSDGSTTLKVYYKYPEPVYKTEYYIEQEDGTYKLHSSKDDAGKTGEEVEAEIIDIEGYVHTTVPELTHEKDTVKADSSTVLKVYYNKVKEPYYKVEYYVEQEDGTYKIYTEKKYIHGETGEEVEAEIITIDGYEHTTTPDSLEKDTVKEDNSTVLKVYYNKVKDPVYKVQYYVQQKDGTYKLYTEKTNLPGKEGEEVEADIIKIPGYVHTTTDESNEKDVVNGDSSTVLKVYYDIEPEEPTTEEPTTEEPTTEEPTTEEPTTEEPTTKEPTTEEPTTEEPTTEKPTVKEPTTQPPTTKPPVKEVKTGDSTSNSLFVMFLSAMAVAYGCFFGRKKKREE